MITKMIRESNLPKAKSIPIIALTALTKEDFTEKAENAGFDFHIGKPTAKKPLLDALKRFMC
jgi:CheY-like chemotaxis protein